MAEDYQEKGQLINCHTHIFTGKHVPPYLARTFVPWPFYYLVSVKFIVRLVRWRYIREKRKDKDSKIKKLLDRLRYLFKFLKNLIVSVKLFIARYSILSMLVFIIGLFLGLQVLFILLDWSSAFERPAGTIVRLLELAQGWLDGYGLNFANRSLLVDITLLFLLLVFFKAGRNLVFFAAKKLWSFLGVLPGKNSKELAKRYINIGRFAAYKDQEDIFLKLRNQYPVGTGFIILPMDMAYMGAGKSIEDYKEQMSQLAIIKSSNPKTAFPFVFAEPRRIAEEGTGHLDYEFSDDTVVLKDCFIKTYIEGNGFSGFKIYPALGYYPFDEALLPLWKYAADRGLPILTHCIRGTIYYRGSKQRAWDHHPVFTQADGKPLVLSEIKNSAFINNFTHPLNYLCLLEETFLTRLVSQSSEHIKDLFGYDEGNNKLAHNLSHLKLCFGHFGGDDEWKKYLESDRDQYSPDVVRFPDTGILFLTNRNGVARPGKIEQLWKYTDWYSIICSMMLQYENVYADLSYIIHNNAIQPLLKQTLLNPNLRSKILFGTDFYVVRNHKSEKSMLAESLEYLCEADFEQIAITNPAQFLYQNPIKPKNEKDD